MVQSRSRKERFKVKLRRVYAKLRQELLYTPQRLGLLLIPVLMLAFLIGSVNALSRNWQLQLEVANKQTELSLLKLEVDNIELENEYLASEEYQELQARKLQNKKLPGETLINLPSPSYTAKTKYKDEITEAQLEASTQTNFDLWMKYLFGI